MIWNHRRLCIALVAVMGCCLTGALSAEAAEPLASAETNWDGVVVKVKSAVRKGSVLTVKFAAVNESNESRSVWFGFTGEDVCYAVDEESGTKYYVLTDKEGHPLAPQNEYIDMNKRGVEKELKPGQTLRLWMKLPAPPPEVKTISLFLNETEPIEDVPITDS